MPTLRDVRKSPPQIMGESTVIRDLKRLIGVFADSTDPVLILGETGTGKELVAQALHCQNTKQKDIMGIYNLASANEEIVSNDLFGHEKGAYTGAYENRRGLAEQVDDGTLYLDEVGDSSLKVQAKLLRFLENGEINKLGERFDADLSVNVRIISSTNVDLEKAMAENKFRPDVFYRLSCLIINLPPLRERKEDIPLLIQHFLQQFAREKCTPWQRKMTENQTISESAFHCLMDYSWPGNIRQLKFAVRSAARLAGEQEIKPEHFSFNNGRRYNLSFEEFLEEARKDYFATLIKKYTSLNQKQLADKAGMSYKAFRNNIKKYGLRDLLPGISYQEEEEDPEENLTSAAVASAD